ncbi:slipin family protein [Candidatus Curtissbacteria bacterium]|nr:slipin family protein [Candidatus Curtissbacteria bacterium]
MELLLSFLGIPGVLILLLTFILIPAIKQVNQYERGVRFRFGKYKDEMIPGWRIVWPIIETWQKIDIRVKAVDVPDQEAITRDNVSARVNAVIYYRIETAKKAVLEVEDFFYAVSQLAQTTMRNVIGETSLDDLLSKRNQVADKIQKIIDRATDPWGVKVESVELKDIILPDEMKRVIARQAEAERERRAIVIRAEGEKAAAQNIATAAEKLSKTAGGLHIRTLQTLSELSADKNNTIVFVTPLEVLRAFEGLVKKSHSPKTFDSPSLSFGYSHERW